jgi:hypothetical protein
MNISQPEHGENGESVAVVNQSLQHPSIYGTVLAIVLLKIIINFSISDVVRNPFDCAGSQGVWSDRWVRDRDHVRSYHRILRRHERRHFYRPRRRRLSVAPVTAAVTASVQSSHRIVECSLSPERLAEQAGTGARADREASIRTDDSRQAAKAP